MLKVAHLYYRQRLTQGEVASRVGVSRQTVSRLLQRAEDMGIVTVEIRAPKEAVSTLGDELEEKFPGVSVVVVEADPISPANSLRLVARAAAHFCERRLAPDGTLGLAWGITALQFARGLTSSPHVGLTVVQVDGSIPGGPGTGGSEYVVHEAADSLGAAARPLMAPLYVDTTAIRDALISDSRTAETLEAARGADIVAFSVGAAGESSGLHSSGILSAQQLAELAAEGAVGEICGQFFAIDGSPRGEDLASRSISISLDELVRVPTRLLFASGEDKRDAVIGALNGRYATDVFVDSLLANHILTSTDHH